jgi:high-affinity iron transporter
LRRSGQASLNRLVWAGVFCAVLASILTALILSSASKNLEGTAEQLYEGTTFLVTAAMLTWMVLWMSGQSRHIKSDLEKQVSQAGNFGGKWAIFLVAFVAVVREGIELSIYLFAASLESGGVQTLLGACIGLFAAGLLGYLLFTATIHLNLQRFFQLTGLLLILFAAGLVAHGIAELNKAGIIPTLVNPIWNLTPYLDDQSTAGSILSVLFGYNASPSLSMALGYSAYLLIIVFSVFKMRKVRAG